MIGSVTSVTLFILYGKRFIFNCKRKLTPPSFNQFVLYLKTEFEICRYSAPVISVIKRVFEVWDIGVIDNDLYFEGLLFRLLFV